MYPSFRRTLAVLDELGAEPNAVLDPGNVNSIVLTDLRSWQKDPGYAFDLSGRPVTRPAAVAEPGEREEETLIVTDPAGISAILEASAPAGLQPWFGSAVCTARAKAAKG